MNESIQSCPNTFNLDNILFSKLEDLTPSNLTGNHLFKTGLQKQERITFTLY